MIVHFLYLAGALLWNALAAAAWRKAPERGPGGALALLAFASSVLGLVWIAQGSASPGARPLFAVSLLLPLSFLLSAWQAARVAPRGQPEAWILVLFHTLLAAVLAARWAWELGWEGESVTTALSFSYAAFQSIAFAPALWFPQFVHLPWLARPERPRGGAAAFVWWTGVSFAALGTVLTLLGAAGAGRLLGDWQASREGAGEPAPVHDGAGDTLVFATRLPPLGTHPPLDSPSHDLWMDRLGVRTSTLVVQVAPLLQGEEALRPADRRVAVERAAGRGIAIVLYGGEVLYPAEAAAGEPIRRHALARAAATAARRWRPAWIFPIADAGTLSQLCRAGAGDSARALAAAREIEILADSVRRASPATRLGIAGFEPWAGTPGADTLAAARELVLRWAARPETPVDRVGLVLHAGYDDPRAFEARLASAERALTLLAPNKRAWVLECAASPGVAGEAHQARHLERVVAWAREHGEIEAVCQTALQDGPERIGLVSHLGRPRQAFASYRRAIASGP